MKEIAAFCHGHGLYLHMDGARIANAAASLGIGLGEIQRRAWAWTSSPSAAPRTACCWARPWSASSPELSKNTIFIRKQSMQLASKMRFIAAQFTALLSDDLWLQNASHANRMAQLLAGQVKDIPGLKIVQPVQANAVFASLPRPAIDKLLKKYFFYIWDEEKNEVRWMTSFTTTKKTSPNSPPPSARAAGKKNGQHIPASAMDGGKAAEIVPACLLRCFYSAGMVKLTDPLLLPLLAGTSTVPL